MTFEFLAGAGAMASAAIALCFLRFWRDNGDRLFLIFAIAFAVFALNHVLSAHSGTRATRAPSCIWPAQSPSA